MHDMNPQHNDLKLAPMGPGDFDRVSQFYRDAIAHTPEMERFGRWIYGLHPTDEMIRNYIHSGAMFTCEEQGEILCAFALTPSQGSDYHDTTWGMELEDDQAAVVHLLCVNPKYQHQGVGRQSMTLAIDLARQMGKQALRLDALASNIPAHRLYESLGFQHRGTARWFADNVGWTDFYLFELILED